MPIVEISEHEDEMLRAVAPPFLLDERSATKRVRWAVTEFLKTQAVTGVLSNKLPEPKHAKGQ